MTPRSRLHRFLLQIPFSSKTCCQHDIDAPCLNDLWGRTGRFLRKWWKKRKEKDSTNSQFSGYRIIMPRACFKSLSSRPHASRKYKWMRCSRASNASDLAVVKKLMQMPTPDHIQWSRYIQNVPIDLTLSAYSTGPSVQRKLTISRLPWKKMKSMTKEPKSDLINFEYSFVWFEGSESRRRHKCLQCFHKVVGRVKFCLALHESS